MTCQFYRKPWFWVGFICFVTLAAGLIWFVFPVKHGPVIQSEPTVELPKKKWKILHITSYHMDWSGLRTNFGGVRMP